MYVSMYVCVEVSMNVCMVSYRCGCSRSGPPDSRDIYIRRSNAGAQTWHDSSNWLARRPACMYVCVSVITRCIGAAACVAASRCAPLRSWSARSGSGSCSCRCSAETPDQDREYDCEYDRMYVCMCMYTFLRWFELCMCALILICMVKCI